MGYCEKHNSCPEKRKKVIAISIAITITITLSVSVPMTLKFAVHPTKLDFSLRDLTVYQFNQTTPTTLTTTLHLSIYSRNPTSTFSLSYDCLRVYASYHSQQITLPTVLPPTVLAVGEDCLWSPFVYAVEVPVTPYLTAALAQEQETGYVVIDVKIDVQLKWRLGSTLFTGSSHVHVSCPAAVACDSKDGSWSTAALRAPQPVGCSASL